MLASLRHEPRLCLRHRPVAAVPPRHRRDAHRPHPRATVTAATAAPAALPLVCSEWWRPNPRTATRPLHRSSQPQPLRPEQALADLADQASHPDPPSLPDPTSPLPAAAVRVATHRRRSPQPLSAHRQSRRRRTACCRPRCCCCRCCCCCHRCSSTSLSLYQARARPVHIHSLAWPGRTLGYRPPPAARLTSRARLTRLPQRRRARRRPRLPARRRFQRLSVGRPLAQAGQRH